MSDIVNTDQQATPNPAPAPAVNPAAPQVTPQPPPTPPVAPNVSNLPVQRGEQSIPGATGAPPVNPPKPPSMVHKILQSVYEGAVRVAGGEQTQTIYDAQGNVTRVPVKPKPAMLGLSLAAHLLAGGMAGADQATPSAAFRAGRVEAARSQAAVQKANLEQSQQAKDDLEFKRKSWAWNFQQYQMLQGVVNQNVEQVQKRVDMMADAKKAVDDAVNSGMKTGRGNSIVMDDIDSGEFQGKWQDLIKQNPNLIAIPYGTVVTPDITEADRAKGIAPQPHFRVMIVDPKGWKVPMDSKFVTRAQDAGVGFLGADGKPQDVGDKTPVDFQSYLDMYTKVTQVENAEMFLTHHKGELADNLGDKAPKFSDASVADEVRTDPAFRDAIQLMGRYAMGAKHFDEVVDAMKANPNSAAAAAADRIMDFLHISQTNLDDLKNEREATALKAKTEAKSAVEPKTLFEAMVRVNDPNTSPEQKKAYQATIDADEKYQKDLENNKELTAEQREQRKQDEKDKRELVYAEDAKGNVVLTSRWLAENPPEKGGLGLAVNSIQSKKPSEIEADKKVFKPLNDIQNNINGYRDASRSYATVHKGMVQSDVDNMQTIFSAPDVTTASAAHAGAEGFGFTLPTLAADLNKNLAKKVTKAYESLTPEGRTLVDTYLRMRGAIPAYIKVLTHSGRANKEQLDIELQNITPPYYDQQSVQNRLNTFQRNVDTQKGNYPTNLVGSKLLESNESKPLPQMQFRRNPQTNVPERSMDGGITWQGK